MNKVARTFPMVLTGILVGLALTLASPAGAVNPKVIANGLTGAIGLALDESNDALYFVDYNAGELRRLDLTPDCLNLDNPVMCPMSTVAGGFSHPEDVALNVGAGLAYVTTRDNPGTGGLYRVELATGFTTLITFNLGGPQQLVVFTATDTAYTVGYNDGRLRRIDLTTGVKTPINDTLDHPVGLAVTATERFAYVTEQGAANGIVMIDLLTGGRMLPDPIVGGLTAPFFMSWADSIDSSVFMAQRSPLNEITRVDVASGALFPVFTGLPTATSAAVANSAGNRLFITANNEVLVGRIGIDPTLHPDLMGIGDISISEIDGDGYANSFDGYYKNAPFGGTIKIFANLSNFWTTGARFYRFQVRKNGGPLESMTHGWSTRHWDPTPPNPAYKPVTIVPVTGTNLYEIPGEYGSGDAAWWYEPFLAIKYTTAENGEYEIVLETYTDTAMTVLKGSYSVLLRVDNIKPVVNVHNIYQHNMCGSMECPVEVIPCDIVDSSVPGTRFTTSQDFSFKITAWDDEGHLRYYRIFGMFGDNDHVEIHNDSYDNQITATGVTPEGRPTYDPRLWKGVDHMVTTPKTLTCNCAYTFYLYALSRATNGEGYLYRQDVDYHKSFTLNQPGLARCVPASP